MNERRTTRPKSLKLAENKAYFNKILEDLFELSRVEASLSA